MQQAQQRPGHGARGDRFDETVNLPLVFLQGEFIQSQRLAGRLKLAGRFFAGYSHRFFDEPFGFAEKLQLLHYPRFGHPSQNSVAVPAGAQSMHHLVGADVVVDGGRVAALFFFAGLVHHVIRRHGVAALGAVQPPLKRIDALTLVEAVGTRAALAVGRGFRLFFSDGLRQLEQFRRHQRLVGRFDDAVGIELGQLVHALHSLVDLDLRDVATIAEQIADGADRPDRGAGGRGDLVGAQPVAHREIGGVLHVDLKELRYEKGFLAIGSQDMVLAPRESKRHEPAVPHAFFGPHPHFNTDLLTGLLALISLGSHQHHLHKAPRRGVAVSGIVQRDEIDAVGTELLVEHVELAAAGKAVVPGADHAFDLPALHQGAQPRQPGTVQRTRAVPLVFDGFGHQPPFGAAMSLQLLDLRLARGIILLGLFLGRNAGVEHHALLGDRNLRRMKF